MQFKRRVLHTLTVEKSGESGRFAQRDVGQSLRRVAESDDFGFNLYCPATSAFLLLRGVNHAQS